MMMISQLLPLTKPAHSNRITTMTKITTANHLPSLSEISPHCVKYYKPLAKKKKKVIDLDDIGTPRYNLLLDLFKCQVKHPNQKLTKSSMNDDDNAEKGSKQSCTKVEKAYSACHSGIMGVGNYNGHKNCGKEMESLLICVNPNVSLPTTDTDR